MANIENDVKQIILIISGLDGDIEGIDDGSTLEELGFTDQMCAALAQELDRYVKSKKPGASVSTAEISADMTVGDVIELIKGKLN